MERDLSVIRKKRALREGVKILMPASSPIDIPAETSNEAMQIEDLQIDTNGDLPMLDADIMTSQLQNGADSNQPALSGDAMMIMDHAVPQDAANSAGLAISLPGEPNSGENDGAKPSNNTNQNTGAKMEDIMGRSDGQEQQAETNGLDFDFESMFNDTEFAAADGSMDFNLDFSSTPQQAGQGQSDSTFGNLTTAGGNLGNIPAASNEDITGMLEDVFNQAGDAANDVPNAISTAPEVAKQVEAVLAQPVESEAGTSEFNDLFGGDTFDLGGEDDITGSSNLADFNFDEEWLKME